MARKVIDSRQALLDERDGRLVDFLVCGTQKGGTTALDAYLREHPQICMAREKELHFFNNERVFSRPFPDYNQYHTSFLPTEAHRCVGESTPIYMYWESAPRRIWEYNPNMRIIVVLRNPIDRAYSHWNMERARGNETLSFWDAIRSEEKRCRESLPHQHVVYSYVDRGFYTEQLRRLWRYFPRESVLVLRTEQLRCAPQEALSRVFEFLGVEEWRLSQEKREHVYPYESKMNVAEIGYLRGVFEYEIRQLERILGWHGNDWLRGAG